MTSFRQSPSGQPPEMLIPAGQTHSGLHSPSGPPQGPASLNSMQVALVALKERCQKQQKRIDELEGENQLLAAGRRELHAEVRRLHEVSMRVRERNLQLSHELLVKSRACADLEQQLELRDACQSPDDAAAPIVAGATSSEKKEERSSLVMLESLSVSVERSDDTRPNCQMKKQEDGMLVGSGAEPDELKQLVEQMNSNSSKIREELLKERRNIERAITVIRQKKAITDQNAEALISASMNLVLQQSREAMNNNKAVVRKCPMCEAEFPATMPQEDFECHVVEHFNYEESDTLKCFDTVPDASFWSCPAVEDTFSG